MQINHPDVAPSYYAQAGNLRTGNRDVRALLNGIEGSPDNYRLGLSSGGDADSTWSTPRHHHNFEQIRFPLDGDYSIGKNQVLPARWVGYFPEAAYYGPQVMSPNLTMMVLQFGGPSGQGYASVAERRRGFDGLKTKGGELKNGIYSWVDENGVHHNQDAFEAVWEEMNGRKIVYPEARYDSLVLMNPANFGWAADPVMAGVQRKHLGTFTEREISIQFLRLEAGATLTVGSTPAAEVYFLIDGVLEHDGVPHQPRTAMSIEALDRPEQVIARQDVELLYMKMPTF